MKLLRHGNPEEEQPGILLNDEWYDTSALGGDYTNDFPGSGGLGRLASFIEKDRRHLKKFQRPDQKWSTFSTRIEGRRIYPAVLFSVNSSSRL